MQVVCNPVCGNTALMLPPNGICGCDFGAPVVVPPFTPQNIISISMTNPAVVTVPDGALFAGATSVTIAGTTQPLFDGSHTGVVVAGNTITLTGVDNSAGPAVGAVGTVTTP